MNSLSLTAMLVFSVLLAAGVTLLLTRGRSGRGDRGRGQRQPVLPALLAGALVLALAVMNVFQYSMGGTPGLAGPTPSRPTTQRAFVSPEGRPIAASELNPLLLEPADQAVVDRFALLFYGTEGSWQERTWLGIRTLQNPNDAWIHQEIIVEAKPDYIIECGTAAGGSAILWAMIQREVNPDGKVITLDIDDPTPAAMNHPVWKERIEFIKGNSTDPATVSTLAERVRGKRVMVILDSDHRKPHVLEELVAYSPMVNLGSYLIVQDTNVNGHPALPDFGPGPMEALDEFMKSNDQFRIDRTRESLLFTLHPRGYLKRVKERATTQPGNG